MGSLAAVLCAAGCSTAATTGNGTVAGSGECLRFDTHTSLGNRDSLDIAVSNIYFDGDTGEIHPDLTLLDNHGKLQVSGPVAEKLDFKGSVSVHNPGEFGFTYFLPRLSREPVESDSFSFAADTGEKLSVDPQVLSQGRIGIHISQECQ